MQTSQLSADLPSVKTRTSTVVLRPDGILHNVYLPESEVEVEDAVEVLKACVTLATGPKFTVYVDLTNVRTFSREARVYFSGGKAETHAIATALLIGSPIAKMMGNFMIGMNKSKYPTRLFTDEAAAIAWLRSFALPAQVAV